MTVCLFIRHIFSIAIFQERRRLGARKRPSTARDIFSDAKPSAPKVFLTSDSQSFIIHISHISCCHISENTLVGNVQEWNHGRRSATCRKGIFDGWLLDQNILIHRSNISYSLISEKDIVGRQQDTDSCH